MPSFAPAFKQFWRLAIFNCKKVYSAAHSAVRHWVKQFDQLHQSLAVVLNRLDASSSMVIVNWTLCITLGIFKLCGQWAVYFVTLTRVWNAPCRTAWNECRIVLKICHSLRTMLNVCSMTNWNPISAISYAHRPISLHQLRGEALSFAPIGCPRIIRTCSFSRFSPLRWNRWCCGFQNFQNYSSGVKAKRHTLPKSAHYSVQSLDQVSVGESFFPFCSKTKQATRYWQEAQPRLP